jgi:hypothetical protein
VKPTQGTSSTSGTTTAPSHEPMPHSSASCRDAAVPAPELHRFRHSSCIWQRQRQIGEARVGGEGRRCVKFGPEGAIEAQAFGLELGDHFSQGRGQGLGRGSGGRQSEKCIALGEQPLAQGAAGGAGRIDGGVGRGGRFGHGQEGARMRVTKTAGRGKSVYGRAGGWPLLARLALLAPSSPPSSPHCPPPPAAAPAAGADPAATVLDAREALRKRDRNRLAALRAQALAEANPLALWVEYWELSNRLGEAQQPELTAFAERWSGSYVEDRLRNDWLLELGRRRDWANFTPSSRAFGWPTTAR